MALRSGTAESVRTLLEAGVNVNNLKVDRWETAVSLAVNTNIEPESKLRLVLKHGAVTNPNPLGLAEWVTLIRTGNKRSLGLLADYGTVIDPIMNSHLMFDKKEGQLPEDEETWKLIAELSTPNRKYRCSRPAMCPD
jgi:hypothetical protein